MPHLKTDKRQKVPKQYSEKKLLKTAENQGKCDSELQFNVKGDIKRDKRANPKKIFKDYKKPNKNVKKY
mgnify:CR=1 FL=1|tara:strand:+ start:7309 stop:7515 length:207 start_codon:yes stop_codon:yes gene_type:complete